MLEFEYDIVDIPKLGPDIQYAELWTWLILYDKNGKIINYLTKMINEKDDFKWGTSFHVSGNTIGHTQGTIIYSFMALTPKIIQSIDHIEVMNEFLPNHLC
jgi:hypothetical protein